MTDVVLKRLARLEGVHDLGLELMPLLSPAVQHGFFAAMDAVLCQEMIEARPEDDETRRGAALMARALRELNAFVRNAVESGQRAPKEMDKLRSRNVN